MLFLFFFTSLLILLSTVGYGLIFTKFLKFEKFNYNYGLIGILGLFTLSIISSYTHLFFSHNYIHNIIILLIGLISLIFINKEKFKQLKFILPVFILSFIFLLIAKTNEDFGYYHLPNTIQFAQQKLQFGLGNLSHGFKHISSLFMVMSLNYLPIFEYYLFNLTNFLFFVFFITFILVEVYLRNRENLNLSNIILSLFLILFLTKFSRLAEYGSDISGQIVISIYFFYFLEFIYNKKLILEKKIDYLKIAIILIIFAITLKFISVIYSILLFTFFMVPKEKKKIFTSLIKKEYLLIIFLPLIIFIFLNFSSTGCLIYPVEKLCFSKTFDWALSSELIKDLNLHYEVWSKGGKGPGFGINNQEEYILFLNWLPNWFNVYFYGKFTDYILVILIIIFLFSVFNYKKILETKKLFIENENNYLVLYLLLFTIFLLWFMNFPSLRYAGYLIVFLLIIFPYSIYLDKRVNLSEGSNIKKISIIFIMSYAIFLYKNVSRVNNELMVSDNAHHNFKNFPFYWVKKNHFDEIDLNDHLLYLTKGKCWAIPTTCIRGLSGLEVSKKNNYIFYLAK